MAEKAITLSQFESLAAKASRVSGGRGTTDLTVLTTRIKQLENNANS